MISTGTGLIPFLEHNDANRALMGSNMQRQAVSLVKKEKPFVRTGLEKAVAKNSESTIIAKNSGVVRYTNHKKVIIYETNQSFENNNYEKLNFSIIKKIKNRISKNPTKISKTFKERVYELEKARKSNQNTFLQQKKIVEKLQWVEKGETIADGNGTYNGELTLGKNLLIGYIGWEGYNFEDAIVINERLVEEDILTSIHIKKYKTFLINNEAGEVRTKI